MQFSSLSAPPQWAPLKTESSQRTCLGIQDEDWSCAVGPIEALARQFLKNPAEEQPRELRQRHIPAGADIRQCCDHSLAELLLFLRDNKIQTSIRCLESAAGGVDVKEYMRAVS